MQSKPCKPHFIDLAKQSGEMGREDCQKGWHLLVASMNLGSVLDVGAGMGKSKERIPQCCTHDVAPGLPVDMCCPLESVASKCVDTVTAFDVIEHVIEDVDFLRELCRIAKRYVFITTPNYNVSKAANGCHCREYTPEQLFQLVIPIDGWQPLDWYSGSGDGSMYIRYKSYLDFVDHKSPHHAVLLSKTTEFY